jgi:hypothetical protein
MRERKMLKPSAVFKKISGGERDAYAEYLRQRLQKNARAKNAQAVQPFLKRFRVENVMHTPNI